MKRDLGRIAVTGLGSISAAGTDMAALWDSARAGRVNVQTRHVPGLDREVTLYAADDKPAATPRERRLARQADRSVRLALTAAREAWQDARLYENSVNPLRIGLIVGSSRGPAGINGEADLRSPKRPTDSAYTTFSSLSGIVAATLQIQGCALMTSATCISGAAALKTAMQFIQAGELDAVLVGGADAPLVDSLIGQFAATGVVSGQTGPGVLRPFARDRDGTVLGEGAAFLVIESEASARRRGVAVRGFIPHVAVNCDSHFRTGSSRDGEGLGRTVEHALSSAALKPGQIDLIHLHGTGTLLNDAMESRSVHRLFGPEEKQPWSWASKGITGHTLGASALFQVVLTLKAMRHSFIPGTTNCIERGADCPLRLSLGPGMKHPLQTALCLTSGFWGNTSCVVVAGPES